MDRRMSQGLVSRLATRLARAGLLGWSVLSSAQTAVSTPNTVPDAQVEANVLKALAGASDLANQPITTTTVYGVVTLGGTVQTEALRSEAETLASRTGGVKKVVDEMTLSGQTASPAAPAGDAQDGMTLQSDGTRVPAQQDNRAPDNVQPPNQAAGPAYGPGAPEYRQPYSGQHAPSAAANGQPNGYPQQNQSYPQPPPGYPQQQSYPAQPGYAHPSHYGRAPQAYGGQLGGEMVTVPSGAMVRIRINQALDSNRNQPGERFDGIVVNDVVADGAVAIPRGATVQGTVIDVQKSGALSGRGTLSLELTAVTLAGKSYPLASDVWSRNGANKTTETVNKTAIGGGLGALIGAAAGGGAGAAIGAGVGGALGLGSSAASGNGPVYIPSEGVLTFHLAQPAAVATVSQEEMDRLGQGVAPGAQSPPVLVRRRVLYRPYGPVYYPGYPPYSPYPAYPYPY